MEPPPGAPSDNTTLVGELADLRAAGYEGEFLLEPGPSLRCRACDEVVAAADVSLDVLRRLEGASDPADMLAIVALHCPSCGTGGTTVVAYGPAAGEDEDALLRQLHEPADARGTPERPT